MLSTASSTTSGRGALPLRSARRGRQPALISLSAGAGAGAAAHRVCCLCAMCRGRSGRRRTGLSCVNIASSSADRDAVECAHARLVRHHRGNAVMGGAGSAVAECCRRSVNAVCNSPARAYLRHAAEDSCACRLDSAGIRSRCCVAALANAGVASRAAAEPGPVALRIAGRSACCLSASSWWAGRLRRPRARSSAQAGMNATRNTARWHALAWLRPGPGGRRTSSALGVFPPSAAAGAEHAAWPPAARPSSRFPLGAAHPPARLARNRKPRCRLLSGRNRFRRAPARRLQLKFQRRGNAFK